MKKFSDEFYLGAGATMQLDRQLEEDSGSFKYTCYYGVLRADLLLNNISRYLYSFVNLGYSLLNEDKYWTGKDLKGDLYFGIGTQNVRQCVAHQGGIVHHENLDRLAHLSLATAEWFMG